MPGVGRVERGMQGDLERSEVFIGRRGKETGAWRGEACRGEELSG